LDKYTRGVSFLGVDFFILNRKNMFPFRVFAKAGSCLLFENKKIYT
jgi:hypothetical protein